MLARIWIALAFVIVCAVVGGFTYFLNQPIDSVRVEGSISEEERSELVRTISESVSGGLLSVDAYQLQQQIHKLSWPEQISVRRSWPRTLIVGVSKRTLVARWHDNEYLTVDGQIVTQPDSIDGLPELDCALSEPSYALQTLHRLQAVAAPAGVEIKRIREDKLGEWQVQMTQAFGQDINVFLGSRDEVARLSRVLSLLPRLGAEDVSRLEYADARYPNGVALGWTEALLAHQAHELETQ